MKREVMALTDVVVSGQQIVFFFLRTFCVYFWRPIVADPVGIPS